MDLFSIFRGNRPDVTPVQIGSFLVAGIPVIGNLLHAFGVFSISQEESDALKQTVEWGVVGGGLLAIADAHLRGSRSKADAQVKAMGISMSGAAKAPEDEGLPTPAATTVTDDDEDVPDLPPLEGLDGPPALNVTPQAPAGEPGAAQ